MLDAFKDFFRAKMTPEAEGEERPPELQVATCALLLEIAYADEEFTDEERRHLHDAVQRHFGLDEETALQLIDFAERERRRQVDLHSFTRLINEHYTIGQKMVLLEAMWGLVYADGEVAKHEAYLMRKLSNLLDVKPAYLAEAKKRAGASD